MKELSYRGKEDNLDGETERKRQADKQKERERKKQKEKQKRNTRGNGRKAGEKTNDGVMEEGLDKVMTVKLRPAICHF